MSALTTSRPARARRLALRGAAVALALVLGAAGCSDDEGGNVVADVLEDDSLPTQPAPAPPMESAAGKECVEPVDPTEFEGKPAVEMPVGEVPTELETTDITVGEGAEAVEGKQVTLNYVGVACSTGVEFDTSWAEDREPFVLTLGPEAQVIEGWNEGVVGMKVGGVRRLVIPSDKAYGPEGRPPDIAPDEALVFVVELLEVTDPPAEGETTEPAEGETTEPAEGETTEPAEGETTEPAEGEGDDPAPTDTE